MPAQRQLQIVANRRAHSMIVARACSIAGEAALPKIGKLWGRGVPLYYLGFKRANRIGGIIDDLQEARPGVLQV